ncbi:MAG: hypothetical protein IJ688_14435 [Treponema sp.]|nr:hypothetical protein [Treponema sp.]
MKKTLSIFIVLTLFAVSLTAQSDDDLFGGDDDMFFDDGIEEVADVSAKSDLSKGVLFETGSIKIGGNFNFGLTSTTTLYADDDKDFGQHFKESLLSPAAGAYLSVDARPTQTLRMYSKFGIAYPYTSRAVSLANTSLYKNPYTDEEGAYTTVETSVTDWLSLKELFTDFSIADTAFFRFGLHTVTWGTGYFFSPVSDMINTSSINPEDTDAQVNGSFNLRTQIVLPNSQNCLWFYVIPSTDFVNNATFDSYARDTALAGKVDLVFGNWELGVGAFWKYQNAPKAMLTATGSLKKFSLFGEFVYQYGAASEWSANTDWDDKSSIIQATAGFSRYWKDPAILLAAQYYYDSNEKDMLHQYLTHGHNIAAVANFGRIFGSTDITASIFAMVNFGKEDLPDGYKAALAQSGIGASYFNSLTASALLYLSPINDMKLGLGPYVTMQDFESAPNIALRLTATLGGGKF